MVYFLYCRRDDFILIDDYCCLDVHKEKRNRILFHGLTMENFCAWRQNDDQQDQSCSDVCCVNYCDCLLSRLLNCFIFSGWKSGNHFIWMTL